MRGFLTFNLGPTLANPSNDLVATPYLTSRFAQPITSPFNPVGSTWESVGSLVQTGLIDPDISNSRIVWNTIRTSGFLESGGLISDDRVDLASSQIWIPGTSGSTTVTLTHAATWQAPYIGIEAYVAAGFGSGGTRTFRMEYGDGTKFFYVEWDEAAGTVKLKKEDGGSTTLATYTGTLTAPFYLGLSLANLSLSAQIKTSETAEWSVLPGCVYDIPTTDSLDPRQPARLAACNRVGLSWTSAGNGSGPVFKLGQVRMGYLMGVNGLPDQPVCYSDGTPFQKGSDQYIIFSNTHVPGSANSAIPTANFEIKAINPSAGKWRTQAKVFTNNSETGVTGNNSGTMVYHPATDLCYWFITNYGNPAVVTSSESLKMYFYTSRGFPSGVVVLQNPVAVNLPQSATNGVGDPCLRFLSSTWYLGYSVYAHAYAAFGPTISTIGDLGGVSVPGNWTQIASIAPSGVAIEGNKFVKAGGNQLFIAALNSTTQRVYDLGLNVIGDITNPPGGGATSTHFCGLPFHEGNGGQRYWWAYFDKTEYGEPNFTHGRVRIARSTVLQAGQDYDLRSQTEL